MKPFLALLKKELLSIFFTPMAYIILCALTFIEGFIFWLILAAYTQTGTIGRSPLGLIVGGNIFFWIMLIILCPIVTMRLGSEEYRLGTIETLLSAPISDSVVVLSKFFAALVFIFVTVLPLAVYILILSAFTALDIGPILSSLLGFLLITSYFISIGMLTTFQFKSQVASAIVAMGILLLLFALTIAGYLATGIWRNILSYVDMWAHMEDFSNGIIDTKPVIYYLSGIVFFIFFTIKSLSLRRWKVK